MPWDYWDFFKPSKPRAVKDGIKTKKQRGQIGETWWSQRWLDVLESFDIGARLQRGRSYAHSGQVVSIDIKPGIVKAKVQGSRPSPYDVEIALEPLSDNEWDAVIDVMAAQAAFAAKLLAGEMPQNIEEAFVEAKTSLFPARQNDLETKCSCPDSSNPCKHIAAVYYILADQFDDDPFLIFKLRGRTKDQIIQALRERRAGAVSPTYDSAASESEMLIVEETLPLEDCLDTFWQMGASLDAFSVRIAPPETENAVLRRLGPAPASIGGQRLVRALEGIYRAAMVES